MFKLNAVLLVLSVVGLLQQVLCQPDSCPYAFAPDGTKYDLSYISNRVHQYRVNENGRQVVYNVSICSPLPGWCSEVPGSDCYAPYTTGVCLIRGDSPGSSQCLGSYSNRKIVGLNRGEGVKIGYYTADCSNCYPAGPRASIITLKCDNSVFDASKIYWNNVETTQYSTPPNTYLNGTIYCPWVKTPVSAPVSAPAWNPVSAPVSSASCSYIQAPDGSRYDMSELVGRVFNTTTYDYNVHSYVNTSFSVCGGIQGYCGGRACSYGQAAVCQVNYQYQKTCWGQYDSTASVQGLNYGLGVLITYDHGDYSQFNWRKTILRLACNNWAFPSELYVTSVATDQNGINMYINATIGCFRGYTPVSTPYSYAPQTSWTPSGYNPQNKHVSIQYWGYGTGCNGSDAYMVVVNRTQYCYPGCQILGNKYVMTACDDDVFLPRGVTWVEQINYGSNYFCDTPRYATYKKSRQCGGTFDFSYQECDGDTVYSYRCNSPYCNQCELSSKTSTNTCSYGTEYRCVNDHTWKGRAFPNPLM